MSSSIYRCAAAMIAALLMCGVYAAGASALAPRLALNLKGAPFTGGSAIAEITLGEADGKEAPFTCMLGEEGPLKNNASTDRITPSLPVAQRCETDGYAITGSLRKESMPWTGAFSVSGKVTISEPGPCNYTFGHLSTSAVIPGRAFGSGTAEGYANRGSNLFCPPVQSVPLLIFAFAPTSEPLETELQS